MSLNNYFKLRIKFHSKSNCKYTYQGISTIVFKEENGEVEKVFDTAELYGEIIGAENYKDAPGAEKYINQNTKMWDFRMNAFNISNIPRSQEGSNKNKKISKLLIDIDELNEFFNSESSTTKTIVGFVIGSNVSGGLSDPSKDPLLAEIHAKIHDINKQEIEVNGDYYIFSMFSAIIKNSKNHKFEYKEKINEIKEIDISTFMKKNVKISGYGNVLLKEVEVDFEDAFIQRNQKILNSKNNINNSLLCGFNYYNSLKNVSCDVEKTYDEVFNYLKFIDDRKFLKQIIEWYIIQCFVNKYPHLKNNEIKKRYEYKKNNIEIKIKKLIKLIEIKIEFCNLIISLLSDLIK